MGIPKAFRWLSERYPLISQLIQENRIPEFDNLYLDMNGIIHNCSHNNNEDVRFRISEEQIFLAIFAYIEHLFSKIKPKKLFFMAIDGVAPRAKMNQQRSRRFRTAKEANDRLLEAQRKGEEIPEEAAFDSNQITPGTPFMARLTAQLKYFINKKITEDANWRGVQVVLSGHEVPGEGEHKIMEYIRLAKAQPEYNPNTRHCLYGLDADLIMLGLLSHDPHFCLLREEVLFGPQRAKAKSRGLESTNFYLMHLSLLREYLDIEFQELKAVMPPGSEIPYDLERIIDDFILLAIFVGNDFLPHLPQLHIHEGALNLLFGIYKRIIPNAGGYLNEHGTLNTRRLQLVLDELADFELDKYEEENADANWMRLKGSAEKEDKVTKKAHKKVNGAGQLTITKSQRTFLNSIKQFVLSNLDEPTLTANLTLPAQALAQDRRFLQQLTSETNLDIAFDEFDENDDPVIVIRFSQEIVQLIQEDNEESPANGAGEDEEWEDTDEDTSPEGKSTPAAQTGKAKDPNGAAEPSEWRTALERVFNKYERAPNVKEAVEAQAQTKDELKQLIKDKFKSERRDYYREKMEFDMSSHPEELHKLAFSYVEGLQWVLHYYYDGVASWSWFYPYHYAPKIADLVGCANMTFDFDINTPFRPFEQLMGVLPDLSAALVPVPYRDLMTDENSPIKDFYPRDFATDQNGKKADWEAIVKIPFIDAERLRRIMATREPQLTEEERTRNSFGNSYSFTYDPTLIATYPTSLQDFFPDLVNCRCVMSIFHLPTLGGLRLVKGLPDGVLLGRNALPGFPSLHTLPHTAHIGYHSVNVFQSDSRNESVVLTVDDQFNGQTPEQVAQRILGTRVYACWPFLQEARVVAVSDDNSKFYLNEHNGSTQVVHQSIDAADKWRKSSHRLAHTYSKRYGVDTHDVQVIVHVKLLRGLQHTDDGALVKEWEAEEQEQAAQSLVLSVSQEDARYAERPSAPVEQEFPQGTKVFFLAQPQYGTPSMIIGHESGRLLVQMAFFPGDKHEPNIFAARTAARSQATYFPSPVACKRVRMSALTLSKICSSLMIESAGGQRINAGLNLKFEAKSQKVLGYAQRNEHGWEYSEKALELLQEYKEKFPEIVNTLEMKRKDSTHATDFFPQDTARRIDDVKAWIKEKGVRDFEKVSLYSDQMEKEAVQEMEQLQDKLFASKDPSKMEKAILRNIPRRAILKPEHAASRLQNQRFAVGDRAIVVQDTGSVPLAFKGVVVGLQAGFIDIVMDAAYMGGTTLNGRCSQYRGASLLPNVLLNLSDMQFVQSTVPRTHKSPAHPVHLNGGHRASATAHPTYRGHAHVGHAPPPSTRGRGAPRGLHVGGTFAGATQGQRNHVQPDRSTILQSALNGRSPQQYHTLQARQNAEINPSDRRPPLHTQAFHAVPPPANLNQPSVSRGGFRGGRGRGTQGLFDPSAGRGRGGHVTGHAPHKAGEPIGTATRGRGAYRGAERGAEAPRGFRGRGRGGATQAA